MARRKLKLNIPAGTTLCPKCEGIGCSMCGGKGYYDAHVDRQTSEGKESPTCHGCPFYEGGNECLLPIGKLARSVASAREHYRKYFGWECKRKGGTNGK